MSTRPALVVIPTYDERDNLEPIVRAVLSTDDRLDILVVDDNSPDGTGKLADTLAQETDRVFVLHREKKEGLGKAYVAGFRWALARHYAFVFEMDADFSHAPADLPRFLAELENGADLVIGSRRVKGGRTVNWGPGRQFISAGGSTYARTILGVDIRDLTAGFKCFKRATLEALPLDDVRSSGYGFQVELTYRALRLGLKVVEIPVVFEDRRVGQSKMSRKIFLEAARMVWQLRWDAIRGRL